MNDRKPYPFFYSVEFLTVIFKVAVTSTPFLLAILATGANAATISALLVNGVLQGFLLASKELEIHQNLYTNDAVFGRDRSDAIRNIAEQTAIAKAANSSQTMESIIYSTPMEDLVDLNVKPSLRGAAIKLGAKLFKGLM